MLAAVSYAAMLWSSVAASMEMLSVADDELRLVTVYDAEGIDHEPS